MSFESDMKRFEAKVTGVSEEVIKSSATALFARIVAATPVDTGAAKGNWQVSLGSPAGDEIDRKDKTKSGQPTIDAEAVKMATYTLADRIFYANNLPYIGRLEHGHSEGQAPRGMVAVNVSDWDKIVQSIARQNRI